VSLVYRGFPLTIEEEAHARTLLAGGPAAADLLVALVNDGGLGVWWTSEAGEVYSHAEAISGDYDLSIKGAVEAADRGEGFWGAETSIVLAATAPTTWEQEDWQVPEGSPIDLVSIKYTIDPMDDTAWRTVPVGRTLTAGANGDLPEGLTLEVRPNVDGQPKCWVTAWLDGKYVGSLGWWTESVPDWGERGEILNVEVFPEYRRRGIASAMLAKAREVQPDVHHSMALSDDGRAWSQRVGSVEVRLSHHEESLYGFIDQVWVEAHVGSERVGFLYWYPATAEIGEVKVEEGYRRQGIATKMLEYARQIEPNLEHSDTLTDDGRAWMQAVGSRQTYFHGSAHEFSPGTILTPESGDQGGKHVYLADSVRVAGLYAQLAASRMYGLSVPNDRGIVYEVEPLGAVEPDPVQEWGGESRTADRVRVIRRMGLEVIAALPSGLRFEVTVMPDYLREKQPIGGTVYAFLDGGNPEELTYPYLKDCVGILRWYSSGEIDSVWVHPTLRRQGLATDLLRRAREADPTVHHSNRLTDMGRAWSRAVAHTASRRRLTTSMSEFQFHYDDDWGQDFSLGTDGIAAVSREGYAGHLAWDYTADGDPYIAEVWVEEPHRRKGVAREMLRLAREIEPTLAHSSDLTADGRAWMQAVGMADAEGWWYHFGSTTFRAARGHWVHLGTREAAEQRKDNRYGPGNFRHPDTLFRVKIAPSNPLGSVHTPLDDHEANTLTIWEEQYATHEGQMPRGDEDIWGYGYDKYPGWFNEVVKRVGYQGAWKHDAIYYTNKTEAAGSVSVAVSPNCIVEQGEAPPTNESVGPGQLLLWSARAKDTAADAT